MALSWPWKDEDGYQCPEDTKNMNGPSSGPCVLKVLAERYSVPVSIFNHLIKV